MSDDLENRIEHFWKEFDNLIASLKYKPKFPGVYLLKLHAEHFPECNIGSKEWKENQNGKVNDKATKENTSI